MLLSAIDPWWNDLYAAGGFWIGAISLVVGVVGFIFAIVQIRLAKTATNEAKTAAVAAKEAAEKTLRESKDAFERFVAAHAGRMLSELQTAVTGADWKVAELRSRDMADIISTLPTTSSTATDDKITEAVEQLRAFGHTFAELAEKKAKRLAPKVAKDRWRPLLQTLHARLDQLRAPFRENDDGQLSPDDPDRAAPENHPESPE